MSLVFWFLVSGFSFLVSDFWFLVLVSGFWFLISGFLVSGFWFLVCLHSSSSGAARERVDRLLCRAITDVDVALLTAEVDAAEAAEGADLENVDVRRLLRFVRRDRRIAGGSAFENVERLPRHDHVAVARPVDQLGVVVGDVADD